MGNAAYTYDGKQWQSSPPQVMDTPGHWAQAGVISLWDGVEWRTEIGQPVEFPAPVGARSASFTNVDVATLPLPASIRLGEVVVSVCASYGDSQPVPPLTAEAFDLAPHRVSEGMQLDPTKLHLQASMFQWSPDMGDSVSWKVSGKKDTNAIVMNIVFRGADYDHLPLNPIVDYKTAEKVNQIDLQSGTDYSSLYVALALSKDLTGILWPDGFTDQKEEFGKFAEEQVHMMVAKTVGSAASPGTLKLDSTVDELAVALITIPGVTNPDHKGVWILGDPTRSILSTTTVLQ